jgi:uncharacterized protein YndB with AHSA1/START domain
MKRFKKLFLWLFILLTAGLTAAILFSPYGKHEGFDYKLIKHTVEIDAPVEKVFNFLGNSENAKRWSVFVNHITPLNTDTFADGTPGARRRCYQQADEQGIQWDELITIVEKNKRRQLTCYDLKDFPMTAENLATEQIYEELPGKGCRLSFTLFFYQDRSTWWDELKTYLAAYKVKSIYEENMANIKRIVEAEEK